jgi:hypothetical protein
MNPDDLTPKATPNYHITNIRRGKGARSHLIYANLMDGDTLLMCATLEEIEEQLLFLFETKRVTA